MSENSGMWLSTACPPKSLQKPAVAKKREPLSRKCVPLKMMMNRSARSSFFELTQNSPPPPLLGKANKQSTLRDFFKVKDKGGEKRETGDPALSDMDQVNSGEVELIDGVVAIEGSVRYNELANDEYGGQLPNFAARVSDHHMVKDKEKSLFLFNDNFCRQPSSYLKNQSVTKMTFTDEDKEIHYGDVFSRDASLALHETSLSFPVPCGSLECSKIEENEYGFSETCSSKEVYNEEHDAVSIFADRDRLLHELHRLKTLEDMNFLSEWKINLLHQHSRIIRAWHDHLISALQNVWCGFKIMKLQTSKEGEEDSSEQKWTDTSKCRNVDSCLNQFLDVYYLMTGTVFLKDGQIDMQIFCKPKCNADFVTDYKYWLRHKKIECRSRQGLSSFLFTEESFNPDLTDDDKVCVISQLQEKVEQQKEKYILEFGTLALDTSECSQSSVI